MTSLSVETLIAPSRVTPRRQGLHAGVTLLVLCGLAFRVAPFFDQGGRLLRQFPTEDAYLMLTIARNMALGNGMSTAGGEIPTNGTQPAVTFLWAAGYALVHGDKVKGVALAQAMEIGIGLCAAYMLYRLGRRLLVHRPDGPLISALAAGLWFTAPLTIENGQNCLETEAYAAIVLAAMLAYASSWRAQPQWSTVRCLELGLLLGACFWVRNDAALLVFAACLVRLLSGLAGDRTHLGRRLYESTTIGLAALCIASPWMVFNYTRFGHIMPISGIAEGMDATFAGNLRVVAPKLAEYIAIVIAIPRRIETQPWVLATCLVMIAGFVILSVRIWRAATPAARATLSVVAVFTLLLASFYGLFFGAGYFMSRYLFPISAFLALITVAGLWELWQMIGRSRLRLAGTTVVAVAGLGVMLLLNARGYSKGSSHMHFQVVEWVSANVPANAWVAATQTGTLGYFHDRTINLDGKVNPEALRARQTPGDPDGIPQYIVSRDIAYLADWAGLAKWAQRPLIAQHFELVVNEPERGENGLAVLKRVQQ